MCIRKIKDPTARVLVWIGRVLGSIWSLWFLFIGVGEALAGGEPITVEGVSLALLFSICFAGIFISFFEIDIGAVVAGLGGIAFMIFGYYSAGHNQWIAVLVSGFPFFLASVLMLLGFWRDGGFDEPKKKK